MLWKPNGDNHNLPIVMFTVLSSASSLYFMIIAIVILFVAGGRDGWFAGCVTGNTERRSG